MACKVGNYKAATPE